MRILLSEDSKRKLYSYLKEQHKAVSMLALAKKLKISKSALDKWVYDKTRYVPSEIIPKELSSHLEILDKQVDNWGVVKGGEKTHGILIKKYGKEEIKRRQIRGGQISALKRNLRARDNFKIDINSPLFLELYGTLLGDGWLSELSYEYKKKIWLVGISGHSKLDNEYLMFIKTIIKKILNREASIKYKKDALAMEILVYHKYFVIFMNKEMGFPIGEKKNLKITNEIAQDWNKIKHVIRGVFDTDGCFYFDKTPVGRPYPCISIHMRAPDLLSQIRKQLLSREFRVQLKDNNERLVLKGSKQIYKWMKEIGSHNQRHLSKYQKWQKMHP
jgi:hypothetical protein